jgi:hypothetical protein
MPPLISDFWHHVDRTISARPGGRRGLVRELERLSRGRNKNTYTNWFKEQQPGDSRPNLRLSDVEDVATALNVPLDVLIAPVPSESATSAFQLELPFGPDARRISVEVQGTSSALSVRVLRSA